MIVSPELLENTMKLCQDGTAIWNLCKRCSSVDYETKGIKNSYAIDRQSHCDKGSWNALTASDLIKMKGHDERWFGWGPDDILFHEQIKAEGIKIVETRFPLLHINHPKRSSIWGNRVGGDYHEIYGNIAKYPKTVNYLTDSICPNWNNTVSLLTNTFCTRSCPQCSQLEWRQAFPNYNASKDEIDLVFQAIKECNHSFDRFMLFGGEPLYWDNLDYGLQKFGELSNIGKITLITTIPDWELFEKARQRTNSFIVSLIETNAENVEKVQKIDGLDLTVWNEKIHRVKPNPGQFFEKGDCFCKDGLTFFNGRVYSCPNTLNVNLLHNGLSDDVVNNPTYSEPITNTFVDFLRGKTFGQLDCCPGCVSCTGVHKFLGSTSNHQS